MEPIYDPRMEKVNRDNMRTDDLDDDEQLRCLDANDPQHVCRGPVEYRDPLSGTGRSFPRCDAAWEDRLRTQERLNRDYPDSSTPPAWFDESAAGEHWDSDY